MKLIGNAPFSYTLLEISCMGRGYYYTTEVIFAQIRIGDTSNTKQHQLSEIRDFRFVRKKKKTENAL